MPRKLIVKREVTRKECDWLDRDYHEGEVVYEFEGYTYGVVSGSGIPITTTEKQDSEFVELPLNSIKPFDPAEWKHDQTYIMNPRLFKEEAIKEEDKPLILADKIPQDGGLFSPIFEVKKKEESVYRTEYCGRCARPLTDLRARVGFTAGDQWDRLLCEKCYERAIKRPIKQRYYLWRNRLHNKLQARYLTLFTWYDARRTKVSNKWYAIKYSWDYQTKLWIRLVRRASVFHWIILGLIRWRVQERLKSLKSWSDIDAAEDELMRLMSLYPELIKITEGELPDLPIEKELSILEEV